MGFQLEDPEPHKYTDKVVYVLVDFSVFDNKNGEEGNGLVKKNYVAESNGYFSKTKNKNFFFCFGNFTKAEFHKILEFVK